MFMRHVFHGTRTPLNAALMGLKVLEQDLQDSSKSAAEVLKTAHEVKDATNIAESMLDSMLMFDKVKQGLLVLDYTDEDPVPSSLIPLKYSMYR